MIRKALAPAFAQVSAGSADLVWLCRNPRESQKLPEAPVICEIAAPEDAGERKPALFCGPAHLEAEKLVAASGRPYFALLEAFDRDFRLRCVAAREEYLKTRADDFLRVGSLGGECPLDGAALQNARLVVFGKARADAALLEPRPSPGANWLEELARLDILLLPNEASQTAALRQFIAASLMEIPVIARPGALPGEVDGQYFLSAKSPEEWREAFVRLAEEPRLRAKLAHAAKNFVLWAYGEDNLRQKANALARHALADAAGQARIRRLLRQIARTEARDARAGIAMPDYSVVYSTGRARARCAVVIPLYNYANYVTEALDSLKNQGDTNFDVVVVNDCSTDSSEETALAWLAENGPRFASAALLRNDKNSGLSATRNAGIDYADSDYIMLLDADNMLLPGCVASCAAWLDATGCALVFPQIETFGADREVISNDGWNPARLRYGNYIDAMAMIRKSCWGAAGGYTVQNLGWEDFDLWCKFLEHGFYGINTGDILARYRVYKSSMLRITTQKMESMKVLMREMRGKHDWLSLQ